MDSDRVSIPNLASSTDRLDHPFDAQPRGGAASKSIFRCLYWDLIAPVQTKRVHQLCTLILPLKNHIEFPWPEFAQGELFQTLPIRIKGAGHQRAVRDAIYDKMNQKGFGVVSLYHTLIDAIDPSEFPQSHELACSILNLPVHQDIDPKSLPGMVEALAEALGAEGLEHV